MSRLSKTQTRGGPSASNSRTRGGTTASSSRTNVKPSKTSSIAKKPSATVTGKPSATKTGTAKPGAPKEEGEKKEEGVKIPAMSILAKPKPKDPKELEKLKKKTKRRNAPEGEDIKEVKKILVGLKGQDITVQEFITVIGPYTGDNGACIRQVLQEDLTAFRKLARKVYETMTQDVSDVLLNEQADLTDYYRERKQQLQDRILKAINEIFDKIPNFDFEKYDRDKEGYLKKALPLPQELAESDEELEVQRRQEAYHRLQWLRSEGERLNEENTRLQERLNELKELQSDEYKKAIDREETATRKREQLEAAEAEMKDQLEQLSESMEKSIIEKETGLRMDTDKPPAPKKGGATQKKKSATQVRRGPPRTAWNQKTAYKIETKQKEKALVPEISKSSVAVSRSRSRTATSRQGQSRKERSPFHFSPIKTPPRKEQVPRELSPFHYSPPKSPKTPAMDQTSTDLEDTPIVTSTRVEMTSKLAENRPPPPRRGGPSAPRDSWGGFY